ncbi:hypothetical protein [Lewinella cohaerens]|uniref:hypothetical protein n=1 Tax=Lewinella cohaerens TaxID=70995 RepID=UPI0012EC7476|nr:hypothetical protein [Lewinella cohaerens]
MKRLLLFFGLVSCVFLSDLSAQMTAKSPMADASATSPELAFNDWSIYADQESNTYFIDFEQLALNVNTVVVKSTDGQVMWQEDVFDLPVNSIYELDFSGFSAGEYFIELEAFTGVIRKIVQHKG